MRSLHPWAIATQRTIYVSGGQSDNISQVGCSCEPITVSVSDIRCTVGYKPENMICWGRRKKSLKRGGSSWKSQPYWIRPYRLYSHAPVSSAISLSRVREALLFMPQIQLGTKQRNQVKCWQLEKFCKQQMLSLSRNTQHLVSVSIPENINPKIFTAQPSRQNVKFWHNSSQLLTAIFNGEEFLLCSRAGDKEQIWSHFCHLKQVHYLFSCVLNHKQSEITQPSSVFTSLKNNIM